MGFRESFISLVIPPYCCIIGRPMFDARRGKDLDVLFR
jgi:hypothetical protein